MAEISSDVDVDGVLLRGRLGLVGGSMSNLSELSFACPENTCSIGEKGRVVVIYG